MNKIVGILMIVLAIVGGYCLYLTNENRKLILSQHKIKVEKIMATGVVINNPLVNVEENKQTEGGQEIVATNAGNKVTMRTVASTKQREAELRRQIKEATSNK